MVLYYLLYAVVAALYGGIWAALIVIGLSLFGLYQEGMEVLRATSLLALVMAVLALGWDIYLSVIL